MWIHMLKLRTKCARCVQIGHWAKECTSPPDAHARNKAADRDVKTGFFVAGEKLWYNIPHQHFYEVTLGDCFRKGNPMFCGIQTDAHQGVVDTAAQSGLIGNLPSKDFNKAFVNGVFRAFGLGRVLKPEGSVEKLRCAG